VLPAFDLVAPGTLLRLRCYRKRERCADVRDPIPKRSVFRYLRGEEVLGCSAAVWTRVDRLQDFSDRPAISGPSPASDIFGADYCKKLLSSKKGVTGHAAFTRPT
jgi:hypothetical protein